MMAPRSLANCSLANCSSAKRGFSLLEVMIAVSILGLGLVTVLASQTTVAGTAARVQKIAGALPHARCKMEEAEEHIMRFGYPLLYLRKEGRGIGLVNKLRAYALQDQGFDTVDANTRLGFAVDARDFSIAARILELLSVRQLKLLTNNAEKVGGIEAEGISVVERLPIKIAANPHNAGYLATKKARTGHKL